MQKPAEMRDALWFAEDQTVELITESGHLRPSAVATAKRGHDDLQILAELLLAIGEIPGYISGFQKSPFLMLRAGRRVQRAASRLPEIFFLISCAPA